MTTSKMPLSNLVFGIPYARANAIGVICPACGEQIPESHDRFGEQTTNNYADHYFRHHVEVEPSTLTGEALREAAALTPDASRLLAEQGFSAREWQRVVQIAVAIQTPVLAPVADLAIEIEAAQR